MAAHTHGHVIVGGQQWSLQRKVRVNALKAPAPKPTVGLEASREDRPAARPMSAHMQREMEDLVYKANAGYTRTVVSTSPSGHMNRSSALKTPNWFGLAGPHGDTYGPSFYARRYPAPGEHTNVGASVPRDGRDSHASRIGPPPAKVQQPTRPQRGQVPTFPTDPAIELSGPDKPFWTLPVRRPATAAAMPTASAAAPASTTATRPAAAGTGEATGAGASSPAVEPAGSDFNRPQALVSPPFATEEQSAHATLGHSNPRAATATTKYKTHYFSGGGRGVAKYDHSIPPWSQFRPASAAGYQPAYSSNYVANFGETRASQKPLQIKIGDPQQLSEPLVPNIDYRTGWTGVQFPWLE